MVKLTTEPAPPQCFRRKKWRRGRAGGNQHAPPVQEEAAQRDCAELGRRPQLQALLDEVRVEEHLRTARKCSVFAVKAVETQGKGSHRHAAGGPAGQDDLRGGTNF